MKWASGLGIKAVSANDIGVLPASWCVVAQLLVRYLFASRPKGFNGMTKVDRVPGNNGSHEDMERTRTMKLVLKRPIAQFTPLPKEQGQLRLWELGDGEWLKVVRLPHFAWRKYTPVIGVQGTLPL